MAISPHSNVVEFLRLFHSVVWYPFGYLWRSSSSISITVKSKSIALLIVKHIIAKCDASDAPNVTFACQGGAPRWKWMANPETIRGIRLESVILSIQQFST